MLPTLLRTKLPPFTVMVAPPEPIELDASICKEPPPTMLTLLVAQFMVRMTPFATAPETLAVEQPMIAVSPAANPG